ncbi:MAG TPA: TROVE domain-containing protein [Candidatus Scalindua sp.]|nr:TROVE domain-containing protein [Candidatus Scalindua sp.]
MNYQKHFNTRQTSQKEPIPGTNQVPNSEGGYVWEVDDWQRLERFLILGTEGGTYYINEQNLTVENAEASRRCIQEDGVRVVRTVVEISQSGRAPRNDAALFVLAMCAGLGDRITRREALGDLHRVARIGTHLFNFLNYAQAFRGWGRSLRRAVGDWYVMKQTDDLVYQVIKYRQRNGWTHRDALRKAHPVPADSSQENLFNWITQGVFAESPNDQFWGFILANGDEITNPAANMKPEFAIAGYIRKYGLTREMVPTEFLNSLEVWEALLEKMPMTAMIRNLGKMSSVGLLVQGNFEAIQHVVGMLGNGEAIQNSRVHPIQILSALSIYQQGRGLRGSLEWVPVPQVIDALDKAFYMAFENVEPTNKRIMLALDVSSSMTWDAVVANLTSRELSATMALMTAHVEPNYMFMGFSDELVPLNISAGQRLDDVIKTIENLRFGGTDCSLPVQYALDNNIVVDTFVIYTDNQTWAGDIHVSQLLQKYRREINPEAKLVVVAMTSDGFSIADPNDAGMLDVVGFDTATPQVIANFSRD